VNQHLIIRLLLFFCFLLLLSSFIGFHIITIFLCFFIFNIGLSIESYYLSKKNIDNSNTAVHVFVSLFFIISLIITIYMNI